jgi:putative Holliday junction resolvase
MSIKPPQTLLAFDFGTRFVGIAVGDTETKSAHPLEMIDAEANAVRFARIQSLVEEWRPAGLVVGLPLSTDGSENDMTRRARRFAKQLEGRFRLPVEMVDERLSSASAEESLTSMGRGGRDNKHNSHALAAQIILQDYLNKGAMPPCISPMFAGTN